MGNNKGGGMTTIDTKAFRRALGNFATGVTVMTAQDAQGNKVGVTANSFNSVSLDPALILWSIDKRSGSKDVFLQASHFAVNVLAAGQVAISNNFARPMADKFAEVTVHEGLGNSLLIPDCAAHFECERYQTIEGGDHIIIIGKVVRFSDNGRAPLLYHQGVYAAVLPHTDLELDDQGSGAGRRGFLTQSRLYDNMHYLLTQAVSAYQSEYYPKQLATGYRVSEARLLIVLAAHPGSKREDMLKEIGMPMREIDVGIDALANRGMLVSQQGRLSLTDKGLQEAKKLVEIAASHQNKVFQSYSPQEISVFKRILMDLMKRAD